MALQDEISKYNNTVKQAYKKISEKENIKFATVVIVHPNNTYDIKFLGEDELLTNVKALPTECKYYEGDTVIVTLSYGDTFFPQITGRSTFEYPEEELWEFGGASMHCAMGDWARGYQSYVISDTEWEEEDSFDSYSGDECINICLDANSHIYMVEGSSFDYLRVYSSAGVFSKEIQFEV